MHALPSLSTTANSSGTGTQALALNDSGQIVGSSVSSTGSVHAVVWQNSKITDLNSAVKGSGLVFARATGVNKNGQIVVEQQAADGSARAFLLSPKH
jgi:probable HAF family extracellular repeat protein